MKIPVAHPTPAENLAKLLCDPRTAEFLGRTAELRLEVLAHVLSGTGTATAIAKRFNVTRNAVHMQVSRARRIFAA